MKRSFLTLLLLIAVVIVSAQTGLYNTKTAKISFFSSTPLEDIKSENPNVNCILNIQSGELAFKVIMQSFQFEKQAMKDHFNSDFVESATYPYATLSGTIAENNSINYTKNGAYTVTVKGYLTIHGVKKPITQTGKLEVKNGAILLNAKFNINLSDYNVRVPNNYLKKISNKLEITVEATLQPYTR